MEKSIGAGHTLKQKQNWLMANKWLKHFAVIVAKNITRMQQKWPNI